MRSSVHAVYRRFTSFLYFPLGKNCINRNKQTEITQKEELESIAFRDISRCSTGLTGAMWPALRPAAGRSQHACYVHAMTHAERKAWRIACCRKQQNVTLCRYSISLKITSWQQLNFRRRIKSRLPFAGIIRRLPYSTRFQGKG